MNKIEFDHTKMTEAEVSLRVAIYLIEHNIVEDDIFVSIDGAQIKTGNITHFDINSFTSFIGMKKVMETINWQGIYEYNGKTYRFIQN